MSGLVQPGSSVLPSGPLGRAGCGDRRIPRGLLCVLTLSALVGCAATTPQPTSRIDIDEEVGFSITEEVRIASDVRDAYEEALGHLEAERYEQGVALLQEVTERAPNVTAAHIDLGIAHSRMGELQQAEESLETALSLNPRHPVAHNELGMVHRKMGRFEAARESYEQALEVHPLFHYARRNLAILCDVYLADLDCALEHYEIYQEAVPDDDEAAMWIADLRRRVSD